MMIGGQGISNLSVRRPYLAAVFSLLIIIAGIGAIWGVEVRELPDVDRPVVSVRAPIDLMSLHVRSDAGGLVPLSQIVTLEERGVAAELDRHEQRRAIEIDASVSPEVALREIIDDVRVLSQEKLSEAI